MILSLEILEELKAFLNDKVMPIFGLTFL